MKSKKTAILAVAAAALSCPALGASNLENPLYLPSAGEIYSKTSAGVMYRHVNNNDATHADGTAGNHNFPIWRLYEDLGVGITDRLTIRGSVAWTQNDDANRHGLSEGRLGLNYRILNGVQSPIVWDVYGDVYMAGLDKMNAALAENLALHYNNYSAGQYGVWLGTQVGKTWGNFSGALYGEVMRTFGNDNNKIDISGSPLGALAAFGVPSQFNVDTAGVWHYGFGARTMYQLSRDWSVGASLTYRHYADEKIDKLHLDTNGLIGVLNAVGQGAMVPVVAGKLQSVMGNMHDGWDDWTLGLSLAHQFTETVQGAVYATYTYDVAGINSQDGSDGKAEVGLRLNLQF